MSNQEIFKKSGYLEENAIQNLSHEQVKLEIAAEIMRTKQAIGVKELEMMKMKNYISCLDYQALIKRLELAWKAKDILLTPHYWSHQNVGFVKMIYEFASDGALESVCFILEGDGPLFLLVPISRWVDKIYRRLILTAAVWRLADCPAAEIPYWGHLKWFKRETNE